jgi:penicillin-binding protein 2
VIEPPLQRRAPLPPQLNRRVGVLGVAVLILFGVIVFRLWYLQVLTGTQNAALARANIVQDIPIAAPRGNILDASGNVLATWRVAPEVAIVADELPPRGPKRWALYERLGGVLGMGAAAVRATVDAPVAPPGFAPTDIKDEVSYHALDYLAERKPLFPGVVEQEVYLRDYPHGDIGSVVLGQVGQITAAELGATGYKGVAAATVVGQSGLEGAYQSYLQGVAGVKHVEIDAAGYPISTQAKTQAPVPGDQLSTSLDLPLEREGYIAMRQAQARAQANHDPAPAAAFVAIDPTSGRVLALGSDPTYDANAFAGSISTPAYDAILASGALNDRATDGQYPTGSVFKPITALGALARGLITPQTTQGGGACVTFGTTQKFCNSGLADYGDKDLTDALAVSEDTYFYKVGAAANLTNAIQDEARALGLGSNPGIDLPGGGASGVVPDPAYVARLNTQYLAANCSGSRPVRADAHNALAIRACSQHLYQPAWTIGQNVLLATGQGFLLATPLQMAVAYSAIVNDGTVWTPQIGRAILSPSGALVAQLPPPASRHVNIDATDRAAVMAGLHAAAQSPQGTSYPTFGSFPRTVYGKTGTAQFTNKKDQSWYVVYAPDPRRPIVIAVTVEQGGFGAAAAAPAARLMLSQWFGLPKKFIAGSSQDK